MNSQNYANHSRYVPGFHFILSSLLIIGTIGSIVNIYFQWSAHYDLMSGLLITVLFICGMLLFFFTRTFPLKAQDRAIRAEENLRFFILTNKPMDSKVTMSQIIALRFASNDEFVILAARAAKENLSADEIKKEIRNWRTDNYRV